jgi:hypothetical protein
LSLACASITLLYPRLIILKQPISRGCKIWDECAGIQIGIISLSEHIWSNWGVRWLLCPSSIRRRYLPFLRLVVDGIKSFWSHSSPIVSVVHPLSLTAKSQSVSRLVSVNYAFIKTLPLKMMHGGRTHPDAFIASIVVTYCRFPGCKRALRPYEVRVTTLAVAVRPRAKPVSSKL